MVCYQLQPVGVSMALSQLECLVETQVGPWETSAESLTLSGGEVKGLLGEVKVQGEVREQGDA